MKKREKFYFILLILIVFVVLGWFMLKRKPLVCFEGECFEVEIADDIPERTLGLMYRESLDDNSGMLFIFDKDGQYGFWMKNTLIPLDIIWIDSDGRVVHIANAEPCVDECVSYVPDSLARYVLEINGGRAEDIGLKVGDSLDFGEIDED